MYRLITLTLLLLAALPDNAEAHSLGLSQLRLNQTDETRYTVVWQPSPALAQRQLDHTLRFPEDCRFEAPLLHCPDGLVGQVSVAKLPPHAEVVLHLTTRSGQFHYQVMPDGQTELALAADSSGALSTFRGYLVIGAEHILQGIDHLLFVTGLVLLVGFNRGLIRAITAFTLSHSLTLVLSMLDLIRVPVGPVEVVIALSIVLVVREAMARRETLTRRWPWLIAFGFGLVHGLGFASALGDIGLPERQELTALLAFNLGVEGGQLAALAVIWAAVKGYQCIPTAPRRPAWLSACYLAGTAASFWTLERTWSLFA